MIRILTLLLLGVALAACGDDAPRPDAAGAAPLDPILSSKEARHLFGAKRVGSAQSPAPIGGYANGCLAGGVELPETGPTWQAMRLSRNRNWGHPVLLDYLEDLSRAVAAVPGTDGIYIGDLSQPRGGPMLTGHRSHQIGLDADIWLRSVSDLGLSEAQREDFPPISMRRSSGAFTNNNWTRVQHELIKAAASDPRAARIFVFPGAKVAMCRDETGDRSWLRKVRPWWGHHYHMHVRLTCPRGARACVEQAAPPPGDGCAEAQEWVDRILNPPPPDPDAPPPQPRRELTMAELPRQCAAVLAAD